MRLDRVLAAGETIPPVDILDAITEEGDKYLWRPGDLTFLKALPSPHSKALEDENALWDSLLGGK